MNLKYEHNYDDIINLPHHVSKKHPQMSLYARSAQFAPFAALTGYEDAVNETVKENTERMDKCFWILDKSLEVYIIPWYNETAWRRKRG